MSIYACSCDIFLVYFSTNCANGSSGSSAVDLWFATFLNFILANRGSSANVLICSPESRIMLSNHSLACVCDCWLSNFCWNSWRNPCRFFFISSARCEYHCCAGPIRTVCIMIIRFKVQASWYGESVCSGPAIITMFSVIAFKKSSVV